VSKSTGSVHPMAYSIRATCYTVSCLYGVLISPIRTFPLIHYKIRQYVGINTIHNTYWHTSAGKNSRSVDIKYFWVSEKMAEGTVSLEYVESEKMMADGLTKALGPGRFVEWRDRLLNVENRDLTGQAW